MPPRAVRNRRSDRVSVREPELETPEGPNTLQRPQLPTLRATPSSRRLYSYGSAAEPPKRPGAGLQRGEVIDIGNAVQSALDRHEREMEEENEENEENDVDEEIFIKPKKTKSRTLLTTVPAAEEDGLAQESRPLQSANASRQNGIRTSANAPPRGSAIGTGRLPSGASDDSQRSFAMESDFYDDATITSAPGTTTANTRGSRKPPSRLQEILPDVPEEDAPPQSPRQAMEAAKSRAAQKSSTKDLAPTNPTEPLDSTTQTNAKSTQLLRQPPRQSSRLKPEPSPPLPLQQPEMEEEEEGSEGSGESGESGETGETEELGHESAEEELSTHKVDWLNLKKQAYVTEAAKNQPISNKDLRAREASFEPPVMPRAARAFDEAERSGVSHNYGGTSRGAMRSRNPFSPLKPAPSKNQGIPSTNAPFNGPGRNLWSSTTNQDSHTNLNIDPSRPSRKSLFDPPKEKKKKKDFQSHTETGSSSTDPVERQLAIQREIQERKTKAARALRDQEAEEQREWWNQQWTWITSLLSLDPLRRWIIAHQERRPRARHRTVSTEFDEYEDDDEPNIEDAPIGWWQLLNPMTYLQLLVSLTDAFMDRVVGVIDQISGLTLRDQLAGFFTPLSWIIVASLGVLAALIFGNFVVQNMSDSAEFDFEFDGISRSSPMYKPSFSGLRGKIGAVMPSVPSMPSMSSLPSVSWPTWSRSERQKWELSEGENYKLPEAYLKDLDTLKKMSKSYEDSIKRMESLIPKMVHVELKDGKPVVPQEFLHALRDRLREDGGFLNMEKVGRGFDVSSDQQWQAIPRRLLKDKKFTSKFNITLPNINEAVENKVKSTFDIWVKNNEAMISRMLGSQMEKIKNAGSGREFDQRLAKTVKEVLKGKDIKDTVLSRDEFLKTLRGDLDSLRGQIKSEIDALRPELENLIKKSVKLATEQTDSPLLRSDVISIVQTLVRQAVADHNLETLAKGKIKTHWHEELKNQVNYFSIGSGAIVDAKRTSITFDPHKKGVIREESFAKGLRGADPYPPIAALMPWSDEGDCWCAARAYSRRGNPHGATLSVQLAHMIIPQHIVIEHILPGATTDPDARPKDIEIYAEISDPTIRKRLEDFASTHFPDDRDDWDYTPPAYGQQFVKIGQFRYESASSHDGVHVHRLSSELVGMGAETDQLILRAVSNYGADGHTCFYRVRMLGVKFDGAI